MSDAVPAIDLDRVRREIDEEVRARRAAGDFPPGMERELDLAFARVSPPATTGRDLRGLLEAADRAAFVEARPPTASRLPPLVLVKKAERKLLGWYFNHLAQQVTTFAGATVRTLQVLTERLEHVEQALPRGAVAGVGAPAPSRLEDGLADRLLAGLHASPGRVLVAGEDAGLLDRLVEAGVDAYGVSAGPGGTGAAGVERRSGDPLDHLVNLAPDSLGGVVLLGLDPLATATKLAFVEAAVDALADGGRLSVVGHRPERWGEANPVEADLAPGRPLRPGTWVAVLEAGRFVDAVVHDGGDHHVVSATLRR
ncbi:MAG: hypothetical protein AB7H43_04295 [Acidimicrobiia bacterium]